MTPLFTKLNLKLQQTLHVLNAPASFAPELAALKGVTVHQQAVGPVGFALAFAVTQAELDAAAACLMALAEGDAVLWFAYPKGSSKKFRCEFNRDTGWALLGQGGYEPVRQVAIDSDWSALRFRRAEHIGKLTRNPAGAISEVGRKRAEQQRR